MKEKYKEIVEKTKYQLYLGELSLVEYFKVFKELREIDLNLKDVEDSQRIKIAILGSSTLEGLREVLDVKCRIQGLFPSFYLASYNQYNQEILNENSSLYKFNPDLTIIWINIDSVLSENFYFPYRLTPEERKKLIDDNFLNIKNLIRTFTTKTSSKVVLHNFRVPVRSSLGILEYKQNYGFNESIRNLNQRLFDEYKSNTQVFVFDFEGFLSRLGKSLVEDEKLRYSADMRIRNDFIPYLCEEYMGYIKPMKSLVRKCLVLDLDNTLWGGIVGEDGFDGVQLGPKPPGNAFVEFQKRILSLYERGVILAINSKNNPEDALKVIREHPYMVLREKHFAAIKLNWNNKAANIKEIAKELNIGLNSLVFLDDDQTNRALVREMVPEVLTIEMPKDPSLYAQTLMNINDFNILQLTEEDKKRGRMYAEQRKRRELESSTVDLTDFLKKLKLKVKISEANSFTIPRISQLTQKTNQFNMTTRRYLEEDIKKFVDSDDFWVYSAEVKDRFGDNGLTGVTIVKKSGDSLIIDTFLLSCRVIGKRVEDALLAFIIKKAKKECFRELIGEFIPTRKNVPAKDFYSKSNFKLLKKEDKGEIWSFDLENLDFPFPDFIEIEMEDEKL